MKGTPPSICSPIFKPVSRLVADAPGKEALVHRAIAAGVAIHSAHTALDAAGGGTNDVLAELCGLTDLGPFEFVAAPGAAAERRVPAPGAERVAVKPAPAKALPTSVLCVSTDAATVALATQRRILHDGILMIAI